MTRTLIISSLLVLTACVNDSPVYVTGFFPLPQLTDDGKCSLDPGDSAKIIGGFRDLTTGAGYSLIIDMKSDMDAELDTVADDKTLVKGIQRNNIIFDQVQLSYTVVPSSITLENESIPISLVAAPNEINHIGMGIIGPKAAEKLATALPNVGDRADVRVKFVFTGNIQSGGKISSVPATYPISFGRSAPITCAAGSFLGRNGPCGSPGGQDNFPICCDTDPATVVCD